LAFVAPMRALASSSARCAADSATKLRRVIAKKRDDGSTRPVGGLRIIEAHRHDVSDNPREIDRRGSAATNRRRIPSHEAKRRAARHEAHDEESMAKATDEKKAR